MGQSQSRGENNPAAPGDWEIGIRQLPSIRCYVLENLENGFLNYWALSFGLSKIDRIAVALISLLCRHTGMLTLIYPVQRCNVLPVLCLEALYARQDPNERPYVFCITRNVAPRQEFMRFRNPEVSLHGRFFPVGMLRGDGAIRDLSKVWIPSARRHRLEPRLVFSPSCKLLIPDDLAQKTSAAIIEVDETVEPDTLLRLRDWADGNDVPVLVYLVTNPFSEQARQLFECDVPVWGWNSDLLHALYPGPAKVEDPKPNNPFSPADEWLYNLSGNQRFVVAPVEEGRIVSVLEETRERYRQFLHSARREKDQGLLRVASRLLSAIYALEELPVPAALYDREAVHVWGVIPVGRRLMALEKARSSIERSYPTAASFLGVTMQLLHSLHDMVESSGSGKPAVLLAAIDEAIRQGASTAVLVRNRAARRAVESFLRDHGKRGSYLLDHDVYIVTPRELSLIDQVSTLLFTSAPRFRQRHLLRYPRTRNLAFLAYPSEVPTISYLLKYELRKLESMLNFDAQVSTISSITGLRRSKVRSLTVRPESEDSSAPEIVFTTPQGATVQETELEPIFPDFLTQEQGELESAEEGEGPESEDPELEESGEPVEALIIRLESGKTLLTKKSRYVSRYLEPTNAVDNISASRLRAGDLLVLVDESVKKSLTQIAIERVDRHPAMVEVISYQRSWVDVLCDGMERKGDTSTTLLRKLQRKGSSIQTPVAIHLWRLGVIIGPRDKQDLKRIGEIYEDDFLVDKVERIYRAVERLRSIHRKLAQRLRHLIPRAGVGWKNLGDEDLVIDRDLNLYLEDFADAVRIDRVIQLDGPVEIDPSLLNRTFEGESWKE